MGRHLFRLPDIGEGVAEAEITAWHVAVGDRVEEDQSVVDVMTDKATMDIGSPVAGRVVARHGEVGDRMQVGATLLEFETEGQSRGADASRPSETAPAPPPAEPVRQGRPEAEVASSSPPPTPGAAPLASPATRRRAHELGIPLQSVPGTGPDGRITAQDLQAYVEQGTAARPRAGFAPRSGVTETRITGLRRVIADRMQEAARRIPHFGYVEECDLTELEGLRNTLNEERAGGLPHLTLLAFLMRALAGLLPRFPSFNSWFDDEAGVLRSHAAVHIGIATQTPAGLMVPVVRHAETLDLWDCARELARVTQAAREGTATREELTGSTITLTSLGALGGLAATPIINRPEVAIIAPNRLAPRPVVVGGAVAVRSMMNISSAFDHRVIDGHDAARFIQALKRLLEHPALLFVDRPQ